MKLYCRIRTEEQLKVCRSIADVIICPEFLSNQVSGKAYVDLPYIIRENQDYEMPEGNVVVKNIDELGLLKGHNGRVIADSFLYAYNTEAISFYKSICPDMEFIAPDELNDNEIQKLGVDFIYKIYGRQRVMFTSQNLGGNYGTYGESRLESAKGDKLVGIWEDGYTTLLTYEPVSMIDKLSEVKFEKVLMDFTIETADEVKTALDALGNNDQLKNTTRGHHYKSID